LSIFNCRLKPTMSTFEIGNRKPRSAISGQAALLCFLLWVRQPPVIKS
jgi:hypothetical protein